jgi:hypothetical protein
MPSYRKDRHPDLGGAVEEITRRAISDLEDLARGCPAVRAFEIQRTVALLRASLPA